MPEPETTEMIRKVKRNSNINMIVSNGITRSDAEELVDAKEEENQEKKSSKDVRKESIQRVFQVLMEEFLNVSHSK